VDSLLIFRGKTQTPPIFWPFGMSGANEDRAAKELTVASRFEMHLAAIHFHER
jgi:hypothetical protein